MFRFAHYVLASAMLVGMSVHLLAGFTEADATVRTFEIRSELLDLKLQSWRRFQEEMNQTLVAVADEDLSLETAVEQIMQASRQHFPDFLNYFEMAKQHDLKAEVGKTVIRHFASAVADGQTSLAPLLQRLRAEEAKLPSKTDSR